MFCHIVSAVYLKNWKVEGNSNSIYIFEKDKLPMNGKLRNIDKLNGTEFGKSSYFYLKIKDCNYREYDSLFENVFNAINKDFILSYNKTIIDCPALFRIFYLKSDSKVNLLIRRRSNGSITKFSALESIINQFWNDSQKQYIERWFSSEIETNWNRLVEQVKKILEGKLISFDEKAWNTLILFISTQYFRRGENNNTLFYIFKEDNTRNDLLKLSFFNFIKMYKKEIQYNDNNHIYKAYEELKNKKYFITILQSDSFFIVSDNPIIITNWENKDSIIIPIIPRICLVLTPSKNEKYKTEKISSLDTKKINNIIINNSVKNIAFNTDDISSIL